MKSFTLSEITGKYLKELRQNRGLTQLELSLLADCGCGYVSETESGQCRLSLERFVRLADCLGMHPAHLLLKILQDPALAELHDERLRAAAELEERLSRRRQKRVKAA